MIMLRDMTESIIISNTNASDKDDGDNGNDDKKS